MRNLEASTSEDRLSDEPRLGSMNRAISLRPRYITGLGLIALLAFFQFLVLSKSTADQRQIGGVLDAAGRQRALAERIPLFASRILEEPRSKRLVVDRKMLLDAVAQLDTISRNLGNPNAPINPNGWPPEEVTDILFHDPVQLNRSIGTFLQHATSFAKHPNKADLAEIDAQQDALLASLDRVIDAYVNDAQERDERLLEIQYLALAALIIMILGVMFLIFHPLEELVESHRQSMIRENDSLASVVLTSRLLVETLDVEGLIERFLVGSARILGTKVTPIFDPASKTPSSIPAIRDISSFPSNHRALIRTSVRNGGIEQSADASALAMTIEMPPSGNRLVLFAERERPFTRVDITAIELFTRHLMLSVQNADLFSRFAELDKFKSDLIAMLAHDFRGPLTNIIGYAELIKEGVVEGEEVGRSLDVITTNAWQLSNFASDTLTMSQLERDEIELDIVPNDLVALLTDIAARTKDHRVAVRCRSKTLTIPCDAKRLRQVVENIVGNALKYSHDKPVEISVDLRATTVAISIADRGIGIPADQIALVFERFARASNARRAGIGGTGFGLYLSRMLVQLHGGTILVNSVEGEGSTFIIELPLTERTAATGPGLATEPAATMETLPLRIHVDGQPSVAPVARERHDEAANRIA
jgi:signal transduction histidine kinase